MELQLQLQPTFTTMNDVQGDAAAKCTEWNLSDKRE